MKKDKRISILLLVLICLYLFLPTHFSFAGLWDWFMNKISSLTNPLGTLAAQTGQAMLAGVVWGASLLLRVVYGIVWILDTFVAKIVDWVSLLNPFREGVISNQNISPAAIIWNIFKNFSYILIVFSILLAGFKILFDQEGVAYRLIFNILIVAFIINFSFVLVKESYLLVDALEKGLAGGCPPNTTDPQQEQHCNSKKLGSLIMASMWQKHDPIKLIEQMAKEFSSQETFTHLLTGAIKDFFTNLFLLILAFIMFIILVITFVLIISRYFFILFYAATSSLAIATLVIPESKGTFAQLTKGMRQFDNWINGLIKWLLVVPVFVIMVVIGQIIQEASLSQIQNITTGQQLIEFIMILLFIAVWYIISIITAVRLSGKVGELAKYLAMGSLAGIGLLAARGLIFSKAGAKTAGWLKSTGQSIQSRIGTGGFLGWRSLISKQALKITQLGERLTEKRFKDEADVVEQQLKLLEQQLKTTTSPATVQQINNKIRTLITKYQSTPVAAKISETVSKMPQNAFNKLDTTTLSLLGSSTAPQEVRDAFIDQIKRMSRQTLMNSLTNPNLLQSYANMSLDVISAFANKISQELSTSDVLVSLSDDNIKGMLQKLTPNHPLRQAVNQLSKGLLDGLVTGNINQISRAFADFDLAAWSKSNEIVKILKSLPAGITTGQVAIESMIKSSEPEKIITALLRLPPNDPLRSGISQYIKSSGRGVATLSNTLSPQHRAKLYAI